MHYFTRWAGLLLSSIDDVITLSTALFSRKCICIYLDVFCSNGGVVSSTAFEHKPTN